MPRTSGAGRRPAPWLRCRWPRDRARLAQPSSTCGRERSPHFEGLGGNLAVVAKAPIERVAAFARDRGWKHIRLLSAANSSFKRDYHGEDADGQQVPILTVFKRWPDGAIRLHWASELVFEPSDPGQDMRHLGTVEPLWTLFDLTPRGRPNADEQL